MSMMLGYTTDDTLQWVLQLVVMKDSHTIFRQDRKKYTWEEVCSVKKVW